MRNTGRQVSLGSEEVEESARDLHEQQKKLVLEEDTVRNVDTKLGRLQKRRGNREAENGRFKHFESSMPMVLRYITKMQLVNYRHQF